MKGKIKFAAFIVILALSGCGSYENLEDQKPTIGSNSTTPATQPTPTAKSATPTAIEVGSTGEIGAFSFSVKGTIDTQKYGKKETTNKYVILTIEAKNVGKKPETVSSNLFVLIDDKDRQFSPNNLDILSFDDPKLTFTEINPGLSKTGMVAFEVPNDTGLYALAVRDNMFDFGGAKYIFFKLQPEKK